MDVSLLFIESFKLLYKKFEVLFIQKWSEEMNYWDSQYIEIVKIYIENLIQFYSNNSDRNGEHQLRYARNS